MQPIKELSFAAGRCAGRGCALVMQLANGQTYGRETRKHNAFACYRGRGVKWVQARAGFREVGRIGVAS